MIIWRGWGIVAVPVILACVFGIGALVSTVLGREPIPEGVGAGAGLLCAAVAMYFLGGYMNRYSAAKAADKYAIARREQLYQQIEQQAETATWRDLQGLNQEELRVRWPQQHARRWEELETAAMAHLDQERAAVQHQVRSIHTLFFIPLQWLCVPLVIGGAAAIIGSLSA